MIHGIGDGRGNPDSANFAHALDSNRVDDVVGLINEHDFDVLHVGVHRHVVFGDVGVHDAAEFVVDQRFLVESHADAPHNASHDLTGSCLRIDDAPGGDRVHDAGYPDDADLLVHLHFGENCRVRVACMLVVFFEFGGLFVLDAVHTSAPHRLCDRYRAAWIMFCGNHAARKNDIFGL